MHVIASLLSAVGVVIAVFIMTILILRHKSNLIFDKYPSKGLFYDFKYVVALLVVKLLRRKFYHNSEEELNPEAYMQKLDKPQDLSYDLNSYDFVSFMAANEKGEKIMLSLERRRRGVFKACIYLLLPEHGLLCSPNLPDMMYFSTDGIQENLEFRGNGFHIYPEQCMRLWRIHYDGELKQMTGDKLLSVKLHFTFTSNRAYFNYNRDLSASVIADSLAREAWNNELLHLIRNIDKMLEKRTHYEQTGTLEGEVQIEGSTTISMQLKGFRDHSFGTERCLSTINRYVYFALFLNDGTNMVIGNLSQPSFFLSSLKVGYIYTKAGAYKPITNCNFELYAYGEKGTPPQHQNFIVETDSEKHFVQIKAENTAERYIGSKWESKIYTQFVSCEVNGVQGYGLTEYLYRNKGGRPEAVSCKDPEWYQSLHKSAQSAGSIDDNEIF